MRRLNAEFGTVIEECLRPGQKMSVILYSDEVTPGNPLRPSSDRKFQATYWYVLEWPIRLTTRTAIWPCFGILKSCNVTRIQGGMSGFWSRVLDDFFGVARKHHFNLGVKIPGKPIHTFLGQYGGTLADEKALKEVFDYKGAASTTPFAWIARLW